MQQSENRPDRGVLDEASGELITGEAVALSLHPTSFVLRAVGCLIDYLVYVLGFVLLVNLAILLLAPFLDEAMMTALVTATMVTCLVAVPTAVETISHGRSLGKLAVGARIVRDDGGSIGFRHAFIRALVGVLEIVMTLGGIATVVGLLSARTRRLGDLLAGTFSQQERAKVPVSLSLALPPELGLWATTADVARLPDPLARRVAHFIRQSAGMNQNSRERLAEDLAREVAEFVHPIPPVTADRFLLAVTVLRRARENTALERQKAQLESLAPVLNAVPRGFPNRG